MEIKKLLKKKILKASAFAGIALMSVGINAQTVNVTVENLGTPELWKGFANWFANDGNFENNQQLNYLAGGPWGIPEVKSVLNIANNTISLYPNYNTYEEGNAYWTDGNGNGNKIFEGNTIVERTDLAGQQLVFSGRTVSSTLLPAFRDVAFIKVLDPNANYFTEFYISETLVPGENFTISTAGFTIPAGRIVQYGFAVLGKNANPTQETANGFTVVTADTPQEPGTTNVTISATSPVIGFANWFSLDGTAYMGGDNWGVSDIKTVLNNDGTLDLHPNFNAWGNGTDTYWVQNGQGQKLFEGNTYVQDNNLLNQTVTFSGHCISNSLATGYNGIAFIKVLNSGNQLVNYTHVPLVAGQDFSVTVAPGDYTNGVSFQYGFSVTGVNANPTQEQALGYAKVGASTAGVGEVKKNALAIYPNPTSSILNFSSEEAIEGIQVYNVMGQKVIDAKPNQNQASVDVSNLSNGIYIVNTTVNGKQDSARFVKQ